MRGDSRCGFTLIELLVVISIIGVLIALLLPAVQAAREAARRSQCTNNLKQLALAVHGYLDSHGVMPLGSFKLPPPLGGDPCKGGHEAGAFIAILPFLEQSPLFNAFNSSVHYETAPNSTVNGTGLSVLWCPSDGLVSQADSQHFGWPVRFCSYMGSSGTWNSPGENRGPTCTLQNFQALLSQANGVIFYYSSVRIAGVTDGTSNTFLLGEHAYGKNPTIELPDWGWWFSGNYGDTMFTTMFPINPLANPGRAQPDALRHRHQSLDSGGVKLSSRRSALRLLRWLGPVRQGDDRLLPVRRDDRPAARLVARGRWRLLREPTRSDGNLPGPLDPQRRRGHLRRLLLSHGRRNPTISQDSRRFEMIRSMRLIVPAVHRRRLSRV